jgi:hypothetical protein
MQREENCAVPNLKTQLFIGALLCASPTAWAWDLAITPGPRAVYLAVGNATANADNTTVNLVSVNLSAATLGNGTSQPMAQNSTQANSPFDNYTVCVPTSGEVYVGGFYRLPTTNTTTAILQVSTPAALTNGPYSIAFNQISWTSTAIGNATADIPAGTFISGGTLFLRNVGANRWVENCHAFKYANTNMVADGTYNGSATYTLSAP